jgi:hypothetical protein
MILYGLFKFNEKCLYTEYFKFVNKGFDKSYKNVLTCLHIGEPRWSERFAGIRPTLIHRSNHCTERQVEASNRLCLEKI